MLTQIVKLSYQWIEKKEHFTPYELEYFFDSFLPVINIYSENFLVDNTLAIMLSEGSEQQEMYKFADFFIRNLEKMFFLAPHDIL